LSPVPTHLDLDHTATSEVRLVPPPSELDETCVVCDSAYVLHCMKT